MTLTDDLEIDTNRKVLLHGIQGLNSYQSKDMAKVKVFADKQVDRQADSPKTTCPRSIDMGHKKVSSEGQPEAMMFHSSIIATNF